MSTFTIGEVAERTGFSASALRYYEGIGLVAPTDRTDAGYRLYDESTVARLAFISRAKQLGCSLEEVTDLVQVWDGDRCSPVQSRLHELVTGKLSEAHRQVVETTAFIGQLQSAADQLAAPAVDRPCSDDCACTTSTPAPSSAPSTPIALSVKRDDPPPIACTLQAEAMPDRLMEWSALLTHVARRSRADDGSLRLTFDGDVPLGELARLLAAEQQCCAFFAFHLTFDHQGVELGVVVPDGADEIATAVFGSPS